MSLNPYRPPTAPVSDPVSDLSAGRPALVSVIALYYGLGAVLSVLARYFFLTHLNSLPANIRSQFQSLDAADNAVWLVMMIIKIWAAVSLLRLKEHAVMPLAILLALATINTLRYIFFKNWLVNTPRPALLGTAIGYVFNIYILLYVMRLRKRGVLRDTRVLN
jgi:hypothetical protein